MKLPTKLSKLPWLKISLGLHFLWFVSIVLLWNKLSCGSATDSLSVSITTLEIFLIIVAFGGFWLIRHEVREKAGEEAGKVASDKIEDMRTLMSGARKTSKELDILDTPTETLDIEEEDVEDEDEIRDPR